MVLSNGKFEFKILIKKLVMRRFEIPKIVASLKIKNFIKHFFFKNQEVSIRST